MPGSDLDRFAAELRRLRLAVGLTQEELAARAGLSAQAISKLEVGERRNPYPHTVRALAAALALTGESLAAFLRAAYPGGEREGRGRTTGVEVRVTSRLVDAELANVTSDSVDGRIAGSSVSPAVGARRPPDGSASGPPILHAHNLPAPLTTLIGRERELAGAEAILRHSRTRLLTLSGPPGSGKTRLALGLAEAVLDAFPEGVWFVPLAPLERPELVVPTIAQILGIRQTGRRSVREALKKDLADRRLLLVLDNFEHLLEAAPLVVDLLAAGSAVRILTTSRAPLRVSGEQLFPVPPLDLPQPGDPPPLEDLAQVAAVQLFVERARAVRPSFHLSAENAAAVVEVCRRLDGLPLAIELAAARSGLLEPAELLARLEQRLALLTDGPRDLPPRQRTLRGALSWSYDLLSADEQYLFRQLGVFAGGCTLEAAHVVCTPTPGTRDPTPSPDVLAGISTLIDHGLLRRAAWPGGAVRVDMLESIRAYALERLTVAGELADAQRRHAAYFVALGERVANPRLDGPDGPALLEELDRDHDNLRAALRWLQDQLDATAFVQLAGALWSFWEKRGYWREGLAWLQAALSREGRPVDRARALLGAAVFHRGNDYPAAVALGSEGAQILRELGDEAATATTLIMLADLVALAGDGALATKLLEEGIAIRQRRGEPLGVAWALLVAGHVACYRADFAQARAHFAAALALRRGQPSNELDGQLLLGLGTVLSGSLTSLPDPGPAAKESLPKSNALANLDGAQEGGAVEARRLLEQALALFRARREVRGTARALLALGDLLLRNDAVAEGRGYLQESLALFRNFGEEVGVVVALLLLGEPVPPGAIAELGENTLRLWWRTHLGREQP